MIASGCFPRMIDQGDISFTMVPGAGPTGPCRALSQVGARTCMHNTYGARYTSRHGCTHAYGAHPLARGCSTEHVRQPTTGLSVAVVADAWMLQKQSVSAPIATLKYCSGHKGVSEPSGPLVGLRFSVALGKFPR